MKYKSPSTKIMEFNFISIGFDWVLISLDYSKFPIICHFIKILAYLGYCSYHKNLAQKIIISTQFSLIIKFTIFFHNCSLNTLLIILSRAAKRENFAKLNLVQNNSIYFPAEKYTKNVEFKIIKFLQLLAKA